METYFFSIVIPTLNEEKFLPRLLEDLAAQKSRNFEVIVVDGKSEDSTKKNALVYQSKIPLNFTEVKKRNVSFQKNTGACLAKGQYIVFLDADSQITNTFTKKAEDLISKRKGLIFLPYVDPEENSPEVKAVYKGLNFLIDASQNTKKPLSSVGCMIWEKHFFQFCGGFSEDVYVAEDWSIMQKAAAWGVRGKFLPNLKVKFSFRRIKKEGKLQSIYKLIMGTFHVTFKGPVKNKIFDYEMGGHLYSGNAKKNKTMADSILQMTQKFKKLLQD